MTPWVAVVLGFVEGLTEYLPISSTGHLILVAAWLGQAGEGVKSFEIVIQLGAILAVVVHYRRLLLLRAAGLVRREPAAISLAVALACGFVPTAIAGLLLRNVVKRYLFGPIPVAIALIVGGIVLVASERWRRSRGITGEDGLERVTPGRALLIGLGQCVALWPGASRSMCTILASQAVGLSTSTAAEFSFLLALPTLGAATLYELWKGRHELLVPGMGTELAIGLVVSFVVAWAVIAGFIRYLRTRSLEPFGYYRVALGALVLVLAGRLASTP
jgi:undecaprenyl-diphosphatase